MKEMRTMETTSSLMNNNWWDSEWYKKHKEFEVDERRKHGPRHRISRWIGYFNEHGELIYEFVNM